MEFFLCRKTSYACWNRLGPGAATPTAGSFPNASRVSFPRGSGDPITLWSKQHLEYCGEAS